MNTSSSPRKTSARKPSHLGSYRKGSACGSASVSFASIGSSGGANGRPFMAPREPGPAFDCARRWREGDIESLLRRIAAASHVRARRCVVRCGGPRRPPVPRHLREVDERLAVARRDRFLDLIVEAAARFLGERDAECLGIVARLRTLDVLREGRLGRIAFVVTLREHLLHEPEAVMAHESRAAGMTAHLDEMPTERFEVAARECDVLARMIAVPLDEPRHLRFPSPVDALDERDAEAAVVDAPELHAAVGVVRTHVVDPRDERSALDLDVKPGPLLDRPLRARVGHVVHFGQVRHQSVLLRSASVSKRRARTRCGWSSMRPSIETVPVPGMDSNAATILRARSISSPLGVNTSFSRSTCAGWTASLPTKPSRFAASAWRIKRVSSTRSVCTVSIAGTPAFAAASRHSVRTS